MRTIPFSDALLGDTPIMATFAKAALKGLPLVFEPCHYTRAIQALADRSFPASLSKQQRFSRALDLPEGRLLWPRPNRCPAAKFFRRAKRMNRATMNISRRQAPMLSSKFWRGISCWRTRI